MRDKVILAAVLFLVILVFLLDSYGAGGTGFIIPDLTPVPTHAPPLNSIEGVIYESNGLTPVADSFVAFYSFDNFFTYSAPDMKTIADLNGFYSFQNVSAGKGMISFWFTEEDYNSQPHSPAGAVEVTVTKGTLTANALSGPVIPAPSPVPAEIRKNPYLIYPGNNSSMTVLWQTDRTPLSSLIQWSYGGNNYEETVLESNSVSHQFSYTIESLPAETIVNYKVIVDGSFIEGSFLTAPQESSTSVTFYAYGDTRTQPAIHDSVVAQIMNQVNVNPDELQTMCFHSGDWVGNGSLESYWDNEYFNDYANTVDFLSHIPVTGACGNHDYYSSTHNGELFRQYLPYPFYETSNDFYYSFDYGPLHVCVLDQYIAEYTVGSTQYNWLEQDLSSTGKPWKVVVLHEPAWSASGGHDNNVTVQDNLCPLFVAQGVQIVIQGHNHYYARCTVDGIEYITLGGGGGPLHEPNLSYINVVNAVEAYCFGKFDVSGTTTDVSIIDNAGSVIDSFTINQ